MPASSFTDSVQVSQNTAQIILEPMTTRNKEENLPAKKLFLLVVLALSLSHYFSGVEIFRLSVIVSRHTQKMTL
jgi:hypothetical protein